MPPHTGQGAPDTASAPEGSPSAGSLTLRQVCREFPQFVIWREVTPDRTRYFARSRDLGTNPHTVVTADLGELRAALAGGDSAGRRAAPGGVPSIARMYSYWLGGKDHTAADRRAADDVLRAFPQVGHIARANREFVTYAVAYVAAHGVTAFLDIGAGLPASLNVHQVVQQVNPEAVTCYVDTDEVVLAHARALLHGGPGVTVAQGDLRDPAAILAHPALAAAIDLSRPVCLILASVLHFLDPADADHAVTTLTQAVAPGSYLVLSAGTSTGTDPALLARLRAAYAPVSVVTARPEPDIAAWFTGWDLLPPGLVDVRDWRPGTLPLRRDAAASWGARFLAGVACKPHRAGG